MIHELKCWPEPFQAVREGRKHHEVRKADRHFVEGEELLLREWDPTRGEYTGRTEFAVIGHVTRPGTWGLPADVCVFSILNYPWFSGLLKRPADAERAGGGT